MRMIARWWNGLMRRRVFFYCRAFGHLDGPTTRTWFLRRPVLHEMKCLRCGCYVASLSRVTYR